MKKYLLLTIFLFTSLLALRAQVKIGYGAGTIPTNSAAVLELSNDGLASQNRWRTLMLPKVNFGSSSVFTDSSVWGIAGTATEGAIVYDTSRRATNGFEGAGAYVWSNGAWVCLRNVPIQLSNFSFTNCGTPTVSGLLSAGTPISAASVTLNYLNGNGGSYPLYTSSTVNGITLTASAGTMGAGSGSINYTISGTPIAAGNTNIPITFNSVGCNVPLVIAAAGFGFTNCGSPTISGTFTKGTAASGTVTLNYVNGNGAAYSAFTSSTVNGMTLSTGAGTLTTGSGSIVFNVSGVPTNSGNFSIPVTISGASCNVPVTVVVGACADPGATVGNTGCVTFTYKGQSVTYSTVRAADNHIWLQQSLGAQAVAASATDVNGYGDLFQWGRWDDGHQVGTSNVAAGNTLSSNSPAGLGTGSSNFYTSWWITLGGPSDTWSGTTPSATNGKDPCTALGSGWHMPSETDWNNIIGTESITDLATAFSSRLKIVSGGYRELDGSSISSLQQGWYWAGTAGAAGFATDVSFTSGAGTQSERKGYGEQCRCMK